MIPINYVAGNSNVRRLFVKSESPMLIHNFSAQNLHSRPIHIPTDKYIKK